MRGALSVGEIFREYKDKMYRLALSIAKNEKDAEDILQNAALKVIKNVKRFRGKARLSTWLYKITYNEALMYLRLRRRQTQLSDAFAKDMKKSPSGLFIDWSQLPDEHLLETEFKERMEKAVYHMPIKYRMSLLLHNVEELSLKESAYILGLKVNSLKTRLHRAQMFIKSEIVDYEKDRIEKEERQNPACTMWTGFVDRYAERALDKKRQDAFARRIRDCPQCTSFLKSYTRAIRITKALLCQDIPQVLQSKISTFLLRDIKNSKTFSPFTASK